uniref:Cadherin n=1 Tax=Angiostrongylus cantonensis TaxID=6313 RepID=A0A158P7R2_ANGCA
LDENDNPPKCVQEIFTFNVTENHKPTILGEVKAIDADSALYSPITYSIHGVGSELFAISPQGKLRSLVPMDREKHEQFDLVVRATDAGGQIVVRDVNDNTPRFEHSEYLLEIDEEKSLKRQFEAIDLDIGENGHIVYSLENVPDGTAIDVSGGMLFIGKLDRDTMAEQDIRLVLRATDRGQAPRSSTINITVRVRDINDHWPAFTNSRYSFVLDANISPGGVIGSVKASDADATTPNNAVKYVSEDPRFQISDDGDVIYDGDGILSKASLRENFVLFKVKKIGPLEIKQKERYMTHAGGLSAIEWANSGKRGYTYEITRATSDGFADEGVLQWIEMDKNTGVFRTRQPLPERVKQIRLYLSMKKGKREVPVELIINVVNSSNSVPLFKKSSYKAVVAEDVGIGSRLLQVKADGENPIKYSLEISTGPTNLLDIDDDGFIRNLAKLDFEAVRYIEGRILARNQEGNTASTNFSIILSDVNDNRPVFVNGSVLSTSIDESADVGFVLELSYPLARDGDEGEFSRLLYSLVGSEDHFDIDRRTSTITLASKLDYESQRSHSLTVRCVDNAGEEPFNEVFASVIVLVRDVNDNPPVIHNSDLDHLTVYEDTPVGTSISTVSASDLDEGGKQSVILDANHTLFSVTDGGKLVVAEKLDGHAGERICSHIQATDSGSPPLSVSYPYCVTVYPASNNHHSPLIIFPKPNSIHYFDENVRYDKLLRIKLLEEDDMGLVTYKFEQTFKKLRILACHYLNCSSVHVFISVNDRNDNCPLFPRQVFHLSLVENDRSPPPRQIGHVPVALDADFHTDNTKVCYSSESALFFFLEPTLPVLYTNHSFDREQESEHQFKVSRIHILNSSSFSTLFSVNIS